MYMSQWYVLLDCRYPTVVAVDQDDNQSISKSSIQLKEKHDFTFECILVFVLSGVVDSIAWVLRRRGSVIVNWREIIPKTITKEWNMTLNVSNIIILLRITA